MAQELVIAADIWIDYLNEEESVVQVVEDLIGTGTARTTEAAGAEAILNCETMEQVASMREILVDLPPMKEGRAAWVRAGELAFRLRVEGSGKEISLLDAHTAVVAHNEKADIMTGSPSLESAARFLGLMVRNS